MSLANQFIEDLKDALASIGGLAQFPGPYYEMKIGVGYKF